MRKLDEGRGRKKNIKDEREEMNEGGGESVGSAFRNSCMATLQLV